MIQIKTRVSNMVEEVLQQMISKKMSTSKFGTAICLLIKTKLHIKMKMTEQKGCKIQILIFFLPTFYLSITKMNDIKRWSLTERGPKCLPIDV